MMTKLRTPNFLALFACLGLAFAPMACATDDGETGANETSGDGDGDGDATATDTDSDSQSGDGDGDATDTDMTDTDPTESATATETDTTDTDPSDSDTATESETEGMGDLPDGASCTSDGECMSGNCYLVPFLGGYCGECNEDADCPDGGCTPPNPFASGGSTCNMGELGGGCETSEVCQDGLTCGTVLDLLGLISISTCGECATDDDCTDDPNLSLCAPVVVVQEFSGVATCIEPGTLPQDSFCDLMGSGPDACENFCAPIDIMGLAEIGGCGECLSDDDCGGGTCVAGEFVLDEGAIVGSTCQ